MKRRVFLGTCALPLGLGWRLSRADGAAVWLDAYREPAARIIGEALSTTFAWDRLAELSDNYGPRLAGSVQLAQAIQWAVDQMQKDGLENVRAEKVMVPHWVRGEESAEIVEPVPRRMAMLGLGGSVGTEPEGITAEAIVVKNYDELEANASKVPGRVVVYNVPFTGYGETVRFRSSGASRAAKLGAVATLLRAVGLPGLRTPHTGALDYASGAPKIPAAAISLEDAETLQRMQNRGQRIVIRLKMEAHFEDDAESANVIGEIRGREKPEQVVVLGGHIDSWDVGTGSTDDGGGCIAAWDALRIARRLGLRPRRTLRSVLFVNEENGLRGGLAYRDRYRDQLKDHVLMLESDSGVFRPRGFGFSGSDRLRSTVSQIASLLHGIGADRISEGGGGADIGPAVAAGRVPSMSLEVDGSRYFQIHHTEADTVDKINPMDLSLCVAAMAVMTYVVADLPDGLER
jgi:carboxypeptidase Q